MQDSKEFLSTFLEDADEILQSIDDTVLVIEKERGNEEKLNELFRLVHTLKGAAALIGLKRLSDYAHEIETALDQVRQGQITITDKFFDALCSSFETLKLLVEDVKTGNESERSEEISSSLELLKKFDASGDDSGTNESGEAKDMEEDRQVRGNDTNTDLVSNVNIDKAMDAYGSFSDSNLYLLSNDEKEYIRNLFPSNQLYYMRFVVPPDVPMPITRALLVYRAVEEEMMILRSFPYIEYMEDQFDGSLELVVLTGKKEFELKEIASFDGVVAAELRRVSIEEAEEIIYAKSNSETKDEALDAEVDGSKDAPPSPGIALKSNTEESEPRNVEKSDNKLNEFSKKLVKDTIRVDVDKLDNLINLIGELVINRTRNEDIIHKLKARYSQDREIDILKDSVQDEGRIIYELQESVMQSRMIPVGTVFNRFPLFVRNMARKNGKKIRLVVRGEDTEFDKKLVDGISEPLIHLVRNAIDHGIETVEERIALGKDPEGLLRISAYHEYNQVVIEVEDDGRGVDRKKILRKLVESDAMSESEAVEMSDKEVVSMIFKPGFSTAEEVTESSGRGVGMDAVKRKIEEMNGVIEIKSDVGSGTKIFIKLPLTLAIIKGLFVEFGGRNYVLPLDDIEEVIKIKTSEIHSDSKGGMLLNLRGDVVSVYFIEDLLALPRNRLSDYYYLVLVKVFGRKRGVMVNTVVGEREVVIKNLKGRFMNLRGIAGASIMGDGSVVPIIDIQELLVEERAVRSIS